jgi:hypothetical protein
MYLINRRQFVTLPLLLLFPRAGQALGGGELVKATYAADVGILYDMVTLQLKGRIEERIDRASGEYRVVAAGAGSGIANRFDSTGVLRNGRWTPVQSRSWFDIRGRQSRTEIAYDWQGRKIEYHAHGETFFLRRLRIVDDVLPIADGTHVDDVMSATLNYADGLWRVDPDGTRRTLVVRRRRDENEGPDDVAGSYRAELVPFELTSVPEASGKVSAHFDLSRFSSWAKTSRPARIVFGRSRRPELITSSMILGTSVTIRFMPSDA